MLLVLHYHIPDNFISSLSAHGGLVHVVLCVKSVTSEGVTVLVMNSPKIMTFNFMCLVKMYKILNCLQKHPC